MKILSLFSGCGGMDKGFVDAGFDIVWANDFDKYAVQTYKANFGNHIVQGDITKIDIAELPSFEILIGGSVTKNNYKELVEYIGCNEAHGSRIV